MRFLLPSVVERAFEFGRRNGAWVQSSKVDVGSLGVGGDFPSIFSLLVLITYLISALTALATASATPSSKAPGIT